MVYLLKMVIFHGYVTNNQMDPDGKILSLTYFPHFSRSTWTLIAKRSTCYRTINIFELKTRKIARIPKGFRRFLRFFNKPRSFFNVFHRQVATAVAPPENSGQPACEQSLHWRRTANSESSEAQWSSAVTLPELDFTPGCLAFHFQPIHSIALYIVTYP